MFFSKGWLDLYLLDGPRSLKEKRRIVESIKAKIRSRFNVSVVEVDKQDVWQRTMLGFALVSCERINAERITSSIIEFIRDMRKVEIIDCDFVIETF